MKIAGIRKSNVYILGDDEVLIIDAGVEVEKVKSAVAGRKVVGILLTHIHYDHAFYIEDYIREFKTKAYVSGVSEEYLVDPNKNCSSIRHNELMSVKDLSNFVYLGKSGTLNLGSFKIDYMQAGGHTFTDMLYLIDRNLYCGDLIIGDLIGRHDLYGGDIEEEKRSLQKIIDCDFDYLCSGHFEALTKEEADRVANYYLSII